MIAATTVDASLKSMSEKEAVRQFRAQVVQIQPSFKEQGEMETLRIDSAPAALLRYAGRGGDGRAFSIQAYGVIKDGKFVLLAALGLQARMDAYGPALRRSVESLHVKK